MLNNAEISCPNILNWLIWDIKSSSKLITIAKSDSANSRIKSKRSVFITWFAFLQCLKIKLICVSFNLRKSIIFLAWRSHSKIFFLWSFVNTWKNFLILTESKEIILPIFPGSNARTSLIRVFSNIRILPIWSTFISRSFCFSSVVMSNA